VGGESSSLTRGQAALEAGRFEEAVVEFRQAIEEQPDSTEARVALGTVLFRLQRGPEAMAELQRAAKLDPESASPRVRMGDILRVEGEIDEALVQFRAGLELDPTSERARLGEVQVLHAQGRFKEALALLEEAHQVLPGSGLVAYGLTWMLAASPDPSLRDGERALDLAERVFASKESLPNAELVAEALAELGRCEKAAQWMEGMLDSAIEDEAADWMVERLQADVERFAQGPPCRAAVESPAAER